MLWVGWWGREGRGEVDREVAVARMAQALRRESPARYAARPRPGARPQPGHRRAPFALHPRSLRAAGHGPVTVGPPAPPAVAGV